MVLQEAGWSSLDATVPYDDDDSEMVAHLLGIYSSSSEQDCHDQLFAAAAAAADSYHCSWDYADASFDVHHYGGFFFGSHCGYDSYDASDVINVGSTSMNNNCDSISPLGGPTRLNDGEASSDEIAELGGAQDQVLQPERKSGSRSKDDVSSQSSKKARASTTTVSTKDEIRNVNGFVLLVCYECGIGIDAGGEDTEESQEEKEQELRRGGREQHHHHELSSELLQLQLGR